MKQIIPFILVPALLSGVGWSLFAQEASTPRVTGKVLILQNERAFEGDIEKIGDVFRVRKGGGEIVVASSQALHLCGDWDDALKFMRSRANLDDPDERLRLAKWCQVNHQIERALAEAKIALTMRPKHGATKQMVKVLEVTPISNDSKPAGDANVAPVPQIDLSFESVTAFTAKVQPILMNTCVSCHSASYPGNFKLYRLYEGGERAAMQRNLAAVLSQVSFEKPAASPLLVMAVCAHGDAKTSPISGRQAPPFLALCGWLDQTLADNPQLREKTMALPSAVRQAPPAAANKVVAQLPPLPGVVAAQTAPTSDGAPVPPPIVSPAPAPMVDTPADEFSALWFNRTFHPNRK